MAGRFPVELIFAEAICCRNLPRRPLFFLRVIVCVAASIALSWVMFIMPSPGWFGITRFFVVFACTVIGIVWCCSATIREALFYGVAAYAIQYCAESIIYLASAIPQINPLEPIWVMLLGYPFAALALSIPFTRSMLHNAGEKVNDTALLAVSATILTITMVISFAKLMYFSTDDQAINIICLIYAILCSLLALTIQSGLLVQSHWKREAEFADRMWKLNQQQYELSRNTIDLINVKSHDLKKQINLLRNSSTTVPASQALDSIEQAVDRYDSLAKTGNPTLDVLLTDKLLSAQHQNVTLHYLVDGKAFDQLDAIDLYALFGNILDNAFEAVAQLPEQLRVIDLKATRSGSMAVIRCSNYRAPSPILLTDEHLPATTKPDKDWHGFGLASIRMTAERHSGSAAVDASDDMFTITVMIPLNA
ncbi:histidine kinase [Bifidobacterium sp. DSM 109957]|uniref:Histidine kinase n=2 Tax=Bifidobacterium oedipodis TaxID=2675322 RepID=A0A7Y0ERE7_9BIFI|nr:histidine kinase [Bifidobacterium sp. DSM 109957]